LPLAASGASARAGSRAPTARPECACGARRDVPLGLRARSADFHPGAQLQRSRDLLHDERERILVLDVELEAQADRERVTEVTRAACGVIFGGSGLEHAVTASAAASQSGFIGPS